MTLKKVTDPKLLAQLEGKEPEESLTHKIINYGIKQPLIGYAKFGHEIANLPHNIYNKIPKFQDELDLPEPKNTGEAIAQGIGQYAPSLLVPEARLGGATRALENIPKIGKLSQKMLGNALSQGGYSAIQNPEDAGESALKTAGATLPFSGLSSLVGSGSPVVRNVGKFGLAGLGALAGHELGEQVGGGYPGGALTIAGAALSGLHLDPELEAQKVHLKGVEGTNYKEKIDAARRLGLEYLTPAEASGNPFVGAQQGAAGKTEKGSQLLYEKGEQRLKSEKKAINDLFQNIHSEQMAPELASLYKQSYGNKVEPKVLEDLKENEVFKRAERVIKNKPAFKESLKGVDENSIAYLDHVKKAMDDMINTAERQGNNSEARIMKQTREKLLTATDSAAPIYKKARQEAERQITRRTLESKLNEEDIRGTNFYRKVLQNDKNYEETMHSLRNVPIAQQQLKDMRLVFKDLINPPTVRTAAGLAKNSMTKERSSAQAYANQLKEIFTQGKYDKAAIELITNPRWSEKLHAAATATSKEKQAAKLIDLFGKVTSQVAGQKSK